jgi:uncharacterized repeat protein (TIGR03803 family)
MLRSITRPIRFAIFMICVASLAAQTEKTLYTFNGSDGNSPLAGLTTDGAGNLYGTTFVGGTDGFGEVFELSPNASGGWTETVLHSFTGADGAGPYYSDVIFDAAGNLYGTTVVGGAYNFGTVFELTRTASGWSESVLYSFRGGDDGAEPCAGLTLDGAGNLYGTTYYGGHFSSSGTVFELTPNGNGQWAEKVIHAFQITDGRGPEGGLTLDSHGNAYGVTAGGGAYGFGVVYKVSPSASGIWTEAILHNFTGSADGAFPYAERLVFDSSGNIYGTTQGGGRFQRGTVFRLYPASGAWREQVLYSFEGNVAANPSAGVVLDAAGNLYGTCANGNGVTTVGAVFELVRESAGQWKGTILHTFSKSDGEFPYSPVLLGPTGKLYGTTWLGGVNNVGVAFEISAKTGASSVKSKESF